MVDQLQDQDISSNLAQYCGASRSSTGSAALSKQMALLHQVIQSTSIFWYAIVYIFLITTTLTTFVQNSALLGQLRGLGILTLALSFGLWYYYGGVWMTQGDRMGYHRRLDNGELPHIHWRGFVYWASMMAIVTALSLLNHNFVWMYWAVYGLNFTIFPFPQVFVTLVPTILALMVAFGWLASDGPPPTGILNFVGELGGLTIYSIIAYLPYMLIKARIRRERVFADLEQSHQELELAHTRLEVAHHQLAEAGERDREIAVLRERGRLARDMHDTLGHALVLANVKLEAALRLRAVDPARADHEIIATQQILRDSMAELRASLANLRSPLLPREPLHEVLARMANEAGSRANWEVHISGAPSSTELDERTYEALLRVGSEAITNAERHAGAHTLWLYLGYKDNQVDRDTNTVVLRVSDDGVGIGATCPRACTQNPAPSSAQMTAAVAMVGLDPLSSSSALAKTTILATADTPGPDGHYGILGMRERVAALGGQFLVTSRDSTGGTTIEARLPTTR
jgi:signal transduction histidine kinase